MKKDKCRLCLETLEEGVMRSLFEMRDSTTISAKIMSLAKVRIFPGDGFPNTVCKKCLKLLDKCTQFIQLCEKSDLKLRELSTKLYLSHTGKANAVLNKYSANENSNDVKSEHITVTIKSEINIAHNAKKGDKRNHKKKKQQCTICGKILSSRFRLKTHQRTHSGERPFSCTHCSKTFALKPGLELHLRLHTGAKPLNCKECNAAFRHPSSLRAHMRIHTGETPYRCIMCPKRFHTASNLHYHLRKHTGEKNFECESCGKAFISRGHLKQHLLLHSKEKPHMCSVCGMRLSRASHLRRHLLNLHKNVKSKTDSTLVNESDKRSDEETLEEIDNDQKSN